MSKLTIMNFALTPEGILEMLSREGATPAKGRYQFDWMDEPEAYEPQQLVRDGQGNITTKARATGTYLEYEAEEAHLHAAHYAQRADLAELALEAHRNGIDVDLTGDDWVDCPGCRMMMPAHRVATEELALFQKAAAITPQQDGVWREADLLASLKQVIAEVRP